VNAAIYHVGADHEMQSQRRRLDHETKSGEQGEIRDV
jgi:hypothetical protein